MYSNPVFLCPNWGLNIKRFTYEPKILKSLILDNNGYKKTSLED